MASIVAISRAVPADGPSLCRAHLSLALSSGVSGESFALPSASATGKSPSFYSGASVVSWLRRC